MGREMVSGRGFRCSMASVDAAMANSGHAKEQLEGKWAKGNCRKHRKSMSL
jgi:hypothetical protein